MTTALRIEASSPLAAMQPPSFINRCGFGPDATHSFSSLISHDFATTSFNFKDLSMMKRPHSDYFSMPPPVRGSSPTASLAADLSQNMHIDKSSPQYPTPRRSLFSNNLFASTYIPLTTPPFPSSPAQAADGMDLSPLPHKAPFGTSFEIQLQSPSPEPSPNEPQMSRLSSSCMPSSPAEEMTLQIPLERRRTGPLRPSLNRMKVHSASDITIRPSTEAQLPTFKFLTGAPRSNPSSSLSLSEIFNESSPAKDRSVVRAAASAPVLPVSRVRQQSSLSNHSRTGSPIGQHVRKSSNPLVRPRKQFRRSLSMFEHPDEIMKQDKEISAPSLPSISDDEAAYTPQLPHFLSEDQSCKLPRISKETMIDVLDGKYDHLYEKRVVIDCRFEYEYEGGHIAGAVNFNNKEQLAAQLFDVELTSKALLIFHCEYSAHRAPLMAKSIRNKDRSYNAEHYPHLSYPEAYILDGGYSSFFKSHRDRCYPQNYVEMDAKEHAHACELGMGKVKQRSKLMRAQTFAFGQHSPTVDSSPTTMGRSRNSDDMDLDLGMDCTPVPTRPTFNALQRNQRMFSY